MRANGIGTVGLIVRGLVLVGACCSLVNAAPSAGPDVILDWDVLPNGLMILRYDLTGDGRADHVTLHQIAWSGWTAQPIEEIEEQACADGHWVFIVDYDRDRYVYLARARALFHGDDPQQDGRWTANLASAGQDPLPVADGRTSRTCELQPGPPPHHGSPR